MMNRLLVTSIAVMLGATLVGCQSYPSAPGHEAASATVKPTNNVLLTGRVIFPSRRVASVEAEVVDRGVVSLIDRSNGPDKVVAAGVTNEYGEFKLFKSTTGWAPSNGKDFVLEVMKQMPTATGTGWVSLRTQVLYNDNADQQGWDSLTGAEPDIFIDIRTTGLSMYADSEGIGIDEILGKITDEGIQPFSDGYSALDVEPTIDQITQDLENGNDPVASLIFIPK